MHQIADDFFDTRTAQAQYIWDESEDLDWSPAQHYLRRIDGAEPPWPESLRYHPECYHGATSTTHPALIAAIVDRAGMFTGISRTYLDDEGRLADVSPVRMLLGKCAGGAVHLGRYRPGKTLIIAESLTQGLRLHYASGRTATWAALSAAGIRRLAIPTDADEVLVAVTSPVGRKAAAKVAERWRAEGRAVRAVG